MKFLREIAKRHGMIDVEDGNVSAVIGFIVLSVVMAIGVVILYQIETATPTIANTSGWATTQSSLATTAGSGYGLLAITLIVFAAVAILSTLFMLVRGAGNE